MVSIPALMNMQLCLAPLDVCNGGGARVGAVLNSRQVADGVLDGDGAQARVLAVLHCLVRNATRQVDAQLRRLEDCERLRPRRQRLAGRGCPDEGALARLADAKVAGIEHAKADLHSTLVLHETAQMRTLTRCTTHLHCRHCINYQRQQG